MQTVPITIKRRDLVGLVDVAFDHLMHMKMVGMESTSGADLERTLLNLPCLYCGMVGLVHDDSCDRVFWRGEPKYERILREYVDAEDE